jgi:nicotinic acid phosphoribosyltransferase
VKRQDSNSSTSDKDLPEKKRSEFVELVTSDSRIDLEDLRTILNAKLEFNSSIWIFGMGTALTIALVIYSLPSDIYSIIVKYALTIAVAILYFRLIRRDPEKTIKEMFQNTDYLEAKDIIKKRKTLANDFQSGLGPSSK